MKRQKHNIASLLAIGEKKLLLAGKDPHEARDMYASLFGISKSKLLAHDDAHVEKPKEKKFLLAIKKRCAGIPFAYCVGEQWFYGFRFFVNKYVLIPRPDTEIIVKRAITLSNKLQLTAIADIGTGSGCIAVTLAKSLPSSKIIATDISHHALTVAKKNAQANHVRSHIAFKKGNLLNAIPNSIRLQLICANLPYLTRAQATRLNHEPQEALYGGKKGLALLIHLLQQARQRRIPYLLLEIDPRQESDFKRLAKKIFSEYAFSFLKDLSQRTRVAYLQLT